MTLALGLWNQEEASQWVCRNPLTCYPLPTLSCVGFLNTSLYTGNIDYQNLVTTPGFWTLALSGAFTTQSRYNIITESNLVGLTVGGSGVSLPSGSASYAAIDTGTTLVGGPSSVIQNLYTKIPGAQPGTGNWKGYWIYRTCHAFVHVAKY